jgi:hypothetical protein
MHHTIMVVSLRSVARIKSMKKARDEMFDPKCKTNIDTNVRVRELGKIVVDAMIVYMSDPKNQLIKTFQSLALPCLLSIAEMISY